MTATAAVTRDLLIETAEQLFAESGIHGVSMRRINQAAGQKNTSALHYHFGSKGALIEAIIEQRMRGINARRLQMLDEIEQAGKATDLTAIVSAIVFPLAECLSAGSRTSYYIQFLAQVYGDPAIRGAHLVSGKFDEGYQRCFALIRQNLPEIPDRVLRQRLLVVTGIVVYILSNFERESRSQQAKNRALDIAFFSSNLVDFLVGAISGKASDGTLELLSNQGQRRA
ncbi:TetR/AcrR family transcriptional regulator [Oceanibacterium hippocampi]|uniref:Putative DNA-binding transcriptional regulator n=1 Tax=Oceanibacterium hippocampi TaxID=745714 RepID=A0A1Y5TRX3_9PROT|nr:TetR/AcrR family transcriptional regulator [Oceanibacterium hippocampi]SLN70685.1 putative DNA-binding transcriptional regulator [Oceanibacterium hippocampi]